MTIGRPDLWLSYPERQASYPVSVRHIKILSWASFRFTIARDTLAFDCGIPVIGAPWGLVSSLTHPLGLLHARHTNSSNPVWVARYQAKPSLQIITGLEPPRIGPACLPPGRSTAR